MARGDLNPGYFGPAMRRLTTKQRAFVIAYSEIGGQSAQGITTAGREGIRSTAARRAGYQGSTDDLRRTAHRLCHDPEVIEAMKEFAFANVASDVVLLTGVLSDIAHGVIPGTASEKLKAVAMIFNRIGLHEKTEHKMTVEHNITNDEALRKIENFSKVLGLDPTKLLGRIGVAVVENRIIDAEYTEVDDEPVEEADPFAVPADGA
jgi:phage terminase small subunit